MLSFNDFVEFRDKLEARKKMLEDRKKYREIELGVSFERQDIRENPRRRSEVLEADDLYQKLNYLIYEEDRKLNYIYAMGDYPPDYDDVMYEIKLDGIEKGGN